MEVRFQKARILLVEDNATNRDVLLAMLVHLGLHADSELLPARTLRSRRFFADGRTRNNKEWVTHSCLRNKAYRKEGLRTAA